MNAHTNQVKQAMHVVVAAPSWFCLLSFDVVSYSTGLAVSLFSGARLAWTVTTPLGLALNLSDATEAPLGGSGPLLLLSPLAMVGLASLQVSWRDLFPFTASLTNVLSFTTQNSNFIKCVQQFC